MIFSNTLKFTGLSAYSSNGAYLAVVRGASVIVYDTNELKLLTKFDYDDTISLIDWSPDCSLLMIGLLKKGRVEIKAMEDLDWQCSIVEAFGGIAYARWTPDSRKIITVREFNVQLAIWSLIDKSTVYINSPKHSDKGVSFSSDAKFMALAEKQSGKDYIGIYFTGDWNLVSHFQVDTFDLEDISWSKDGTSIVVWDSPLECKLLIYSPTGDIINSHSPYQNELGVQNAKWSPSGHYLAVGYNDNSIRLYNRMTWMLVSKLNHTSSIIEPSVNIYKEEEVMGKEKYSKYVEITAPVKLSNGKSQTTYVNDIEWSHDSFFIASKCESAPNVIYIWQVSSLTLHSVIIQLKPIKDFQWSPHEHILLIATENDKLYSFTSGNAYIIDLVSDNASLFCSSKISWNSDGRSFTLSDKKQLIIGHPEIHKTQQVPEMEQEEQDQSPQENANYQ